MKRTRAFSIIIVALLAIAAFAPAATAGHSAQQPVSIEVVFTQPDPIFDGDGNLISPPNGYFAMSGGGAVCSGGLFHDTFIGDFAWNETRLSVHDFKVFTCDGGGSFTLEFWVTFETDPEFVLIESSWVVSASSIAGLRGYGSITERDWDSETPREVWSGVFGVSRCKKGGWQTLTDAFGTPFKNQGDCISYLATDGRNLGAG